MPLYIWWPKSKVEPLLIRFYIYLAGFLFFFFEIQTVTIWVYDKRLQIHVESVLKGNQHPFHFNYIALQGITRFSHSHVKRPLETFHIFRPVCDARAFFVVSVVWKPCKIAREHELCKHGWMNCRGERWWVRTFLFFWMPPSQNPEYTDTILIYDIFNWMRSVFH